MQLLHAVPDQTTPAAVVTSEDLTAVLKRLPRGSVAGPSGWTHEHVRAAATTCPAAREAILGFVNLVVSGALPRLPALLAARVVALQKPNGRGVRPLAVGEVWLRVAGLCALQAALGAPASLPPLQLAGGVRGGSQCLGHGVAAVGVQNLCRSQSSVRSCRLAVCVSVSRGIASGRVRTLDSSSYCSCLHVMHIERSDPLCDVSDYCVVVLLIWPLEV